MQMKYLETGEFEYVKERDFPLKGSVPNIFHSSLARVCFGVTLSAEELAAFNATCERVSAAIRGTRCTFDRIWYATADPHKAAMVAPAPSHPAELDKTKRHWLMATTAVRSGDIVSIDLD